VAKTKAQKCNTPLSPKGDVCTKPTKDPSGLCHLHRNGAGGGAGVADPLAQQSANGSVKADPLSNDELGDESVMPLPPEGPEPGDPIGVGVMIADGEVEDSSLCAQSYLAKDGDGTYEMLHLKLTPEGEQKMLDALGLNTTVTKIVEKDIDHHGRHPLDTDATLSEQVEQIARSHNARLKKGEGLDEIKQVNDSRLDALKDAHAQASAKADPNDVAAQQMLAHYQGQIDLLEQRLAPGYQPKPYAEGGKIDQLSAWEGKYTTTESVEEAIPNPDVDDAALPTVEKTGVRIDPTMKDGKSYWQPGMTTEQGAPKKMWEVDLGDGYKVMYYPESVTENAATSGGNAHNSQFKGASMRRRMTVIAPKDGDAHGALERLERIHVNPRPMTKAEAEFTYLDRNASTLGLNTNAAVAKARAEAAEYAEGIAISRVYERKHEAVGLSEPEQREWIRKQRVAADGDALPYRARRLREGLAQALGYKDAADLRADKHYDPAPVRNAGKPFFKRLPEQKGQTPGSGGKNFVHNVGGGPSRMVDIAACGTLASQEKRRIMGVQKGIGMSEDADQATRGASSVFLHAGKGHGKSSTNCGIVWQGKQAEAIANRTDWYVTAGDHFGAQQKAHTTLKGLNSIGGGEFMVSDSIDLRATPPTWIKVGQQHRAKVIAAFKQRGISEFSDGRKIEDVVV
jgi:hypothetical protein